MSLITDEVSAPYETDNYSEESDRPVLIKPGISSGRMMNWEKSFNPMFRKYSLVMNFKVKNEVIPGWFNIKPSDSETTVKAGWKSNFVRMYQECLDIRLSRVDRISLMPFHNKFMIVEVVSIQRDSDQAKLAEVNHYSRVKRIIKVINES
jgi:hypothetical protein